MSRPRLVSDEQIHAITRNCVMEFGPQVSLDVVAKRLGVTQPALLKRFGSRKALMLKALGPQGPRWFDSLEEGPDERSFRIQLHEVLSRIQTEMEVLLPCLSALRESKIPQDEVFSCPEGAPPVLALAALSKWLRRCRQKGLIEVEPSRLESVAAAIIGTVNARIHLSHLLKQSWTKRNSKQFLEDVAALFSDALLPKTQRGRGA